MRLVYTRPALERIAEIQTFWADHTTEDKAEELVTSLMEKTKQLLANPLRGFPEPKLARLGLGYRGLLLGRFKVIYYVSGEEVHITDFFDTKQHPSRMRG